MKITTAKLKEVIKEEVQLRLLDMYINEEFFKLLLEADDDISDEEYEALKKAHPVNALSPRAFIKEAAQFNKVALKLKNPDIPEFLKIPDP